MTAATSPVPSGGGPGGTWTEATPAEVRAALAPESAVEFDRQWRTALAAAAESYDLSTVVACLEAWRRVARVTVAAGGPEGYRALQAEAAAAARRDGGVPRGGSWREVRAELGL
jgi:hypothetical protein